MRVNQTVGIGHNKRVDLLCTVEKLIPGGFEFLVHNGLWRGNLRGNMLTVYSPFSTNVVPAEVLYVGDVAGYHGGDHNIVIDIMNQRINGWVPLWYYRGIDVIADLGERFDHFITAVKAGLASYRKTIKADVIKGKRSTKDCDIDDDIPF